MIFRRRESVVGLDIGPDAVRAVALRRTSRGREVAAIGCEPIPRGSLVGGEIVCREPVIEAIRTALDAAPASVHDRGANLRVTARPSGGILSDSGIRLPPGGCRALAGD